MVAKIGEYKGKPTIVLMRSEDDEYPVTFGLAKAKKVVAHIDEISAFVASSGASLGGMAVASEPPAGEPKPESSKEEDEIPF